MLNAVGVMKVQPRREARIVVVGGGVGAARFVSELVRRMGGDHVKGGKTLCVVLSSYPEGLAPYDRTSLSKEGLDLERLTRNGTRPEAFPWCATGAGEPMSPSWYRDSGVEIWSNTICCGVQLDYRRLTLKALDTEVVCELMTRSW